MWWLVVGFVRFGFGWLLIFCCAAGLGGCGLLDLVFLGGVGWLVVGCFGWVCVSGGWVVCRLRRGFGGWVV